MNTFWNKRILITVLSFWITVLSSRPITKYELKNAEKHATDTSSFESLVQSCHSSL